MPTADGRVATARADRYLVQLCRHAGRMRMHPGHRGGPGHGGASAEVHHVERTDTGGLLRLDGGVCTMRATAEALLLHVDATDGPALDRIRRLLTARIEGFGRRDGLRVDWQHPPDTIPVSQDATTEVTTAPTTGVDVAAATVSTRRWPAPTAGVVLAVALVIAVHVGLGGALLAAPRWTVGVVELVGAVIAVKVLVVVILGRRRRRRR